MTDIQEKCSIMIATKLNRTEHKFAQVSEWAMVTSVWYSDKY